MRRAGAQCLHAGFRRHRAGEQGRSSPPPAPQASLSLSRPEDGSHELLIVFRLIGEIPLAPLARGAQARRGGGCPGRDR